MLLFEKFDQNIAGPSIMTESMLSKTNSTLNLERVNANMEMDEDIDAEHLQRMVVSERHKDSSHADCPVRIAPVLECNAK
jgi:hypothetical protein